MPYQRDHFFVIDTILLDDIVHTHGKEEKRYPLMLSLLKTGKKLPHIVIDEKNVIMDGNTRAFAYKELGRKKTKVFRAVGKVYRTGELETDWEMICNEPNK